MTQLLLGTHRPTWLANPQADPLRPLFLSRNVFTDRSGMRLRRSLPAARGPWALDSGSFTELQHHGGCRDLYDAAGVDLACEALVGVGSVCRRQATGEIATLMAVLAGDGLRLHGFGVKASGLDRYAADLASCDSMSWSLDGRYTRGCGCGCHQPNKSEANCIHHATRWHADTLRRLGAVQLALPIGVA